MIYYIEKFDVNEEKTRLTNHLDYFTKTLNDEKSQGKKLGFITQEIGRESKYAWLKNQIIPKCNAS